MGTLLYLSPPLGGLFTENILFGYDIILTKEK